MVNGKRLEGKGQRIKDSKREGFEVSRGRGVEGCHDSEVGVRSEESGVSACVLFLTLLTARPLS